jgi:predicted nucleotidyltransferase
MNNAADNAIVSKAVGIFSSFREVAAVGLSGSRTCDSADAESDFDFVVLAKETIPSARRRKHTYEKHHITEFPYFDADFEVCRGDGLTIDGVRCDTIWMRIPFVREFIASLDTKLDCDEFLPGGLLRTTPLFDPNGTLEALKSEVPDYSRTRAVHRLKKHLSSAHFHIYVLRWFDKAALRNDYFCFFRHLRDAVEDFVTCLFALNRRWFCDEKRVIAVLRTLELAPRHTSERLTSIITHEDENAELDKCLLNLKGLFNELSAIADVKYPGSEFPTDWK